jgi:hypothetical protein
VRANFFSVRAVEGWKNIPVNIQMARIVGQFEAVQKSHREPSSAVNGEGDENLETRCRGFDDYKLSLQQA